MNTSQWIIEDLYPTRSGNKYRTKLTALIEAPKIDPKLYKNLTDQTLAARKHAEFGDISVSAGDITRYRGYKAIKESISALYATEIEDNPIRRYIDIVYASVAILEKKKLLISSAYSKSNHIALEYDSYLYLVIQSISAILTQFVRFTISNITGKYDIKLSNSKYRADLFYFDQLVKFNDLVGSKDYDNLCKAAISGVERENLLGSVIGASMVMGMSSIGIIVGLAVLARLGVLMVYKSRLAMTECLDEMRSFLELRKRLLESKQIGNDLSVEKRESILQSQKKWIDRFTRLSEVIRIKLSEDEKLVKKEVDRQNIDIANGTPSSSSSPDDILI